MRECELLANQQNQQYGRAGSRCFIHDEKTRARGRPTGSQNRRRSPPMQPWQPSDLTGVVPLAMTSVSQEADDVVSIPRCAGAHGGVSVPRALWVYDLYLSASMQPDHAHHARLPGPWAAGWVVQGGGEGVLAVETTAKLLLHVTFGERIESRLLIHDCGSPHPHHRLSPYLTLQPGASVLGLALGESSSAHPSSTTDCLVAWVVLEAVPQLVGSLGIPARAHNATGCPKSGCQKCKYQIRAPGCDSIRRVARRLLLPSRTRQP